MAGNTKHQSGRACWNKLDVFLSYLTRQSEHGLIVVPDYLVRKAKLYLAEALAIVGIGTQEELFYTLSNNLSALIEVEPQSSPQLMSDVRQCAVRIGALQTLHPISKEVVTVKYNPLDSHILLVVAKSEFQVVEKRFSIKQNVGMIEYL